MSFDAFCHEVACRFIQSVMVVDDQASLSPPTVATPIPVDIVVPSLRTFRTGGAARMKPPQESVADPDPVLPEEISHGLDGMTLTRSFAKLGMACSIYRPEEAVGDEEVENTARVECSPSDRTRGRGGRLGLDELTG